MNEEELIQIIRDGATLEQTHQIIEYIRQLQNNWKELKSWLEEEHREDAIKINLSWKCATGKVLRKMQELEQGKDE